MSNLDSILASIKANIERKAVNTNIDAATDPLHDLADNNVTKSHALSRAYYRFGLVEKRCMEALISKLHPLRSDNNPNEIELSAMEYAKAYNVPTNVAYRDIASAVQAMMHRVITADRPKGKKGKIEFTLMAKAEYKDDEGRISCAFNPYIVPYLIGLREKFSSYPLKKVVNFSSSYTWRFYELLVSWAQPKQDTGGIFAGWFTVSVDELREMLGVPDSYKWSDFQRQVLDVIDIELKEKAHIYVKIERIKTIRKITHLKIEFIESNQLSIPIEGDVLPKKKCRHKPKET
jgi:plasmid replication initiation protein